MSAETRLTDTQQRAIAELGSILVTASAGSGKTTVLGERFVNLIREGHANIFELLALTFSDKGAGEMRGKILRTIDGDERLRPMRFDLDCAYISTIHSFCARLLRENAVYTNAPTGFLIAGELQSRTLLKEAIEDCYKEKLDRGDDAPFLSLNYQLEPRQIKGVAEKLIEFARNLDAPETYFDRLLAHGKGIFQSELSVSAFQRYERLVADLVLTLKRFAEFEEIRGKDGKPLKAGEAAREAANIGEEIENAFEASRYGLIPALVSRVNLKALSGAKRSGHPEFNNLYAAFRSLRGPDRQFKRPYPLPSQERAKYDSNIKALIGFATICYREYQTKKQEIGLLDFNDLEMFACRMLEESPSLRDSLKEKFRFLLLDEFQDTNFIQDRIVEYLRGEDNLFIVGDLKQTIYQFRQAIPDIFRERREQFNRTGRTLHLSHNFRSRKEIISFVNSIFSRTFEETDGLDYKTERLLYGSDYPLLAEGEVAVALNIILKPDRADTVEAPRNAPETQEGSRSDPADPIEDETGLDGAELEEVSSVGLEAELVANRIQELVASGRFKYSDIAIILRKNRLIPIFFNALRQRGIHCTSKGASALLQAPEVCDIINLLKILQNPLLDIPLASLLRSPLFGFSETNLLALRLRAGGKEPLFRGLLGQGLGLKDSRFQFDAPGSNFDIRVNRFLESYRELQAVSRWADPFRLIEEIYRQTGYPDKVLAFRDGDLMNYRLWAFLEIAREIVRKSGGSLKKFILHTDILREAEKEGRISLFPLESMGEASDAGVTLITTHSAKGLEFPAVFACSLDTRFNFLEDFKSDIILHRDLGIAMTHFDEALDRKDKTLEYEYLEDLIREESLREEKRILYVTLTRAKEYLYVSFTMDEKRLSEARFTEQDAESREGERTEKVHSASEWVLSSMMTASPAALVEAYSSDADKSSAGSVIQLWSEDGPFEAEIRFSRLDDTSGIDRASLRSAARRSSRSSDLAPIRPLEEIRRLEDPDELQVSPSSPDDEALLSEVANVVGLADRKVDGRPNFITTTDLQTLHLCPTRYNLLKNRGLPDVWLRSSTGSSGKTVRKEPDGSLSLIGDSQSRAIGVAIHRILQVIKPDEIRADLQQALNDKLSLITPMEEDAAEHIREHLAAFLSSDLGSHIFLGSKEMLREIPFTLNISSDPERPVILQGRLDLLARFDDGWELIDFKTVGAVTTGGTDADSLRMDAGRHLFQLSVYALAAENILGIVPKSLQVCYTNHSKAILVPYDENVKSNALKEISRALEILRRGEYPETDDDSLCDNCPVRLNYGRRYCKQTANSRE